MKKILFISVILISLFSACTHVKSEEDEIPNAQTELANIYATKTQEFKPTSTPIPSPTPTLTPTKITCPDEGWSEIFTYLAQYERIKSEMQVGDSISVILRQLETTKEVIVKVNVSACSQYAKQKYIEFLEYDYLQMYALLVTKDFEVMGDYLLKSVEAQIEARDELARIGIVNK